MTPLKMQWSQWTAFPQRAYRHAKEAYRHGKEAYRHAKEAYRHAKEAYRLHFH